MAMEKLLTMDKVWVPVVSASDSVRVEEKTFHTILAITASHQLVFVDLEPCNAMELSPCQERALLCSLQWFLHIDFAHTCISLPSKKGKWSKRAVLLLTTMPAMIVNEKEDEKCACSGFG